MKRQFYFRFIFLLLMFCVLSCSQESSGDDKSLETVFSKQVTVFDIPIYATSAVSDTFVLHAAKIIKNEYDKKHKILVLD